MKSLIIPELSVVALVGISSCGKSSFAKKHFLSTEVLSSDFFRGLVCDDEMDQSASKDAFDVLYTIAAKRLKLGKCTVIDATNVQKEARKHILDLAKAYHVLPVAIVFDLDEKICQTRNKERSERSLGEHVLAMQQQQLARSIRSLKEEGFRYVYVLKQEEIDDVSIVRQKLYSNLKHDHGPFDIIGDVHGCFEELVALLSKLGYSIQPLSEERRYQVDRPFGRKAIFLGDLVDRGPKTPEVIALVMEMVEAGIALCVPGNHDIKLMRKLSGRKVKISHGMEHSLAQLSHESPAFIEKMVNFIDGLTSHYVLDDGMLVVAHAGLKEEFHGRGSSAVRSFATFGDVSGEVDEEGLPERLAWYNDYRGKAMVVYGHTAILEPQWINNTIDIDTGCVFGGKLTALRYPEKEILSIPANAAYYKPAKPLGNLKVDGDEKRNPYLLDIQDVLGKRVIECRHYHKVGIREEEANAALELISRFAVDPKWLIYLPPTMSPAKTSSLEEYLEHPHEAFEYYREVGISKVMCQEKHMGSRAILIICKDGYAASKHFGDNSGRSGICYTRTGRPFFADSTLESGCIAKMQDILTVANWWEKLNTEWVLLDCEIMPWSAKAESLLREQYAAVGCASQAALKASFEASHRANLADLSLELAKRKEASFGFIKAYQRYSWPVHSIDDYVIAPFHILATQGNVHYTKDHEWHMGMIQSLSAINPDWLKMTAYRVIDVNDPEECARGYEWWSKLGEAGGEGMVVKPLEFTVCKKVQELIQPGIKIRDREYLRIIYGPEYTLHLARLKERNLGKKRSLALREFALGLESLARFVENAPLYKVHECVFACLALESEPIDPRL